MARFGYWKNLAIGKHSKTGSITNAAKEMKMAYRQAWQLVEEMNQRAENPLVENY